MLPCSLVELYLRDRYKHLPSGVLPSSLLWLTPGGAFCQPLQVGTLAEGLLFLRDRREDYNGSRVPRSQPSVLPSTLLGVDFTDRYNHPMPAGAIPSSVCWVRLPHWYQYGRIDAVLLAHAMGRWY